MALKKPSKRFIDRLCKFILREQGRGFAMDVWEAHPPVGKAIRFDHVVREIPKCGTVCCIGGSIQALSIKEINPQAEVTEQAGELIGLEHPDAYALFYGWDWHEWGGWPKRFRIRYSKAKTPAGKARVAVSMLKLAVRTGGKCFHENLNKLEA